MGKPDDLALKTGAVASPAKQAHQSDSHGRESIYPSAAEVREKLGRDEALHTASVLRVAHTNEVKRCTKSK
jgi:hypothetical protein